MEFPACRRDQFGAFTSAQAREVGLTRHQVQHLLRTSSLVALRRGVYVDAAAFALMTSADRLRAQAVAACLARPGAAVSHYSAALIHDLPSSAPTPRSRP